MCVQRSTKSISIDYILIRYWSSNRPWPPRVLASQAGTDAWRKKKKKKKKNDEKGYFFKLGSEQRCHRLGSEKMAF